MWEQLNRIIKKNGAIVLFGSEPFSSALRMSNIKNYKYDWVWLKTKAMNFQQAKNSPLKKHENIIIFSDGAIGHLTQNPKRMPYNPQSVTPCDKFVQRNACNDPHKSQRINGIIKGYAQTQEGYPTSVLKYNSVHNPPHPTQKPLALMEYLIKTYTNEGEIVLDFTCGSGTTLLACKKLNRKYIGIEKEKKYCDIAEKRLSAVQPFLNFGD